MRARGRPFRCLWYEELCVNLDFVDEKVIVVLLLFLTHSLGEPSNGSTRFEEVNLFSAFFLCIPCRISDESNALRNCTGKKCPHTLNTDNTRTRSSTRPDLDYSSRRRRASWPCLSHWREKAIASIQTRTKKYKKERGKSLLTSIFYLKVEKEYEKEEMGKRFETLK